MTDLNLGSTPFLIVKIAAIFGLAIYNIFAFIVIRQVSLMTQTLEVDLEGVIKVVSVLHFIFALCVLIFAIVI